MTALRPDLHLPCEARGQLRLEAPTGKTLDLVADGETLRLEVARLRDIRSLLPVAFRKRGRVIRDLSAVLTVYGMTLRMESAGRPVFEMGRSVRPNWLARLLGLAPARLPFSAALLLFRR